MRLIRSLFSWLRSWLWRERVERELDAELRFHLEQETAARIAAGDDEAEARAAARRAIGSVAHAKDGCRDSLGLRVADALQQDLRHTVRTLFHQPGFALVVVLSLGLGIGGNTAIFRLINAVRLRTLPVPDPAEIVSVRVAGGNRGLGLSSGFNSDLTFALWQRIRESQTAFSGVFAWGNTQFLLGSGADADVIEGLWVSGELFPVLRLSPVRGRLLTTTDDQNGCGTGGAVLSYAYWLRRFGGDEAVVGKSLSLMGRPVRIIGVAQKGFFGLEVGKSFDVALPICAEATWGTSAGRRDVWWLTVMGRLKPDWTVARAFKQLNALSPGIFEATVPPGYSRVIDDQYRRLRLTATAAGNGSSRLRESYDTPLLLLLAMTGMVLLVACVNLANLMLARATARQREIAVRIAIGASSRRVVFQFLTEGLVLSMLGGALGLGLSSALSRGLVALLDSEVEPILIDVSPDWRVLAFSAGVAISTCLVFALIPALRSLRGQPLAALKDGGGGATRGRDSFSIHRVLVASQIALSLILLAGALLFVRSFRNLTTLDAGFRRHGIVFAGFLQGMSLPPDQRPASQQRLLEEIQSVPGVSAAALTTYIPLANASWTLGVHVPNSQGEEVGDAKFTYVSPEYFATMDVPLVSGRDFNTYDRADSARVAIVNEAFVRRYIRAAGPIGARLRTVAEPGMPSTVYDVIGVVKDTKYGNLREGTPAMAFVPSTQNPDRRPSGVVAIRTSVDPDALIRDLRQRLRASHPDVTVRFRVFERQIQEGLSRERLMAWLAGFFGIAAAVLAVIGLYGLLSYIVQRRHHEIGIRVALGATWSSVVLLVLRQTALLVVAGLSAGLPICLVTGRSASSLLFGLSPTDLPTLAAAAGLLAAIAACASLAPAWRAARIDPIRALREE
jgi:putative ABC transport system permease protein